jgi:hypothetical protein
MAYGVRILAEALRSIDTSTLTGIYQPIGGPTQHQTCLAKFVNTSTQLITISWDGGTDQDILPGNSFVLYDVTSDAGLADGLYISKNTQFYVKGAAGSGSVYLTILYPIGS